MTRPQFTIRTALVAMLIAGLALGWYATVRRENARVARLAERLKYFEEALKWSKQTDYWERLATPGRSSKDKRSLLWLANLDGANLKDATILGGVGAFTNASFVDSNLQGTTLTGGTSSFQQSKFDGANLVNAKLTGGVSAFQYASFANADLSGAVITGGGAAFQLANLEGAKLIGAKLTLGGAAFQKVNINGAQFQSADLSMISPDALASCYFDTPPTYDETTKLPAQFDPVAKGWTLVKSQGTQPGH